MPSRLEREHVLTGQHQAHGGTKAIVAALDSSVAVVVTHPWGPLGGNMHNNVVVAACLYFQKLGLSTCRFDFCGTQIGRGLVQVEQLKDVCQRVLRGDFHTSSSASRIQHILFVGYSYGSLITSSASADIPECLGCISIAPPFAVQHWLLMFHSQHHLQRAKHRPDVPRLFILGERDNFTSPAQLQQVLNDSFPNATGAIMSDCDHFFARRETQVMQVICEWLESKFGDVQKLSKFEGAPIMASPTSSTSPSPCN